MVITNTNDRDIYEFLTVTRSEKEFYMESKQI